MSTKADRAMRAARHILPVVVNVRQGDGSVAVQRIDADVREDKRRRRGPLPGSAAYVNEYARTVNRALRLLHAECPRCGNKNHALIETNDVSPSDVDFTLLCIARVWPKDEAIQDEPRQEPDAFGLVKCGMQWCPNAEDPS